MAASLNAAREEERTRISRQIHDEIGQGLTALKIGLTGFKRHLSARSGALNGRVQDMAALADSMLAATQRIGLELRPAILDVLGLPAAIRWAVDDFHRRMGITCRAKVPAEPTRLDGGVGTVVFRILQEALTNIARHAGASSVDVTFTIEPERVDLVVVDNGRGITAEEIGDRRSLGLLGIRERAQAWGGEVTIRGVQHEGTTVSVRIPLSRPSDSSDTT